MILKMYRAHELATKLMEHPNAIVTVHNEAMGFHTPVTSADFVPSEKDADIMVDQIMLGTESSPYA